MIVWRPSVSSWWRRCVASWWGVAVIDSSCNRDDEQDDDNIDDGSHDDDNAPHVVCVYISLGGLNNS
jgi:hypothetical protein